MKSSTEWNCTPNANKLGSGIGFVPYMPMSLYKWNMTSRSGTPVVGRTVYVHFRPVTAISMVHEKKKKDVGGRGKDLSPLLD